MCSSAFPGVYFNHTFSLGLFQIHESFVADGGLFTNSDMQSIFHTRMRRTQHSKHIYDSSPSSLLTFTQKRGTDDIPMDVYGSSTS